MAYWKVGQRKLAHGKHGQKRELETWRERNKKGILE